MSKLPYLGTDLLPQHVQDCPVVDHEVPDPGPHRCVAERLLEHHLGPGALTGHAVHPVILIDPGVEEQDLIK